MWSTWSKAGTLATNYDSYRAQNWQIISSLSWRIIGWWLSPFTEKVVYGTVTSSFDASFPLSLCSLHPSSSSSHWQLFPSHHWPLPPPHVHFFLKINFYWSIVDLQCCVSFYCAAKWISYTYTYISSFLDFLPVVRFIPLLLLYPKSVIQHITFLSLSALTCKLDICSLNIFMADKDFKQIRENSGKSPEASNRSSLPLLLYAFMAL